MKTLCDSLDRPYVVYDSSADRFIEVPAPSPLGALYNAHMLDSGRIPDVSLWDSGGTLTLGKFTVTATRLE